jgi:CelD/BcsL family acetyltransferase involved in cellulose biosynthesis
MIEPDRGDEPQIYTPNCRQYRSRMTGNAPEPASESATDSTLSTVIRDRTPDPVTRALESVPRPGPVRRREEDVDRAAYDVALVETIDDVDERKWNDVVERSPQGTPFHRYEWLEAVETELGYEPAHVVVTKGGHVIGAFPNFVLDLPKTPFRRISSARPEYGGPLLPTDFHQLLPMVLNEAAGHGDGRTIVHEIREHTFDHVRYAEPLIRRGYRPYVEVTRHLLDLTRGRDELLDRMASSRRAAIRRAREQEYEIVEEELTNENVARFHRSYVRVMNRLDGEVLPLSFFRALTELENTAALTTLRIDGEYAGGAFNLYDGERSIIYGYKLAIPSEFFEQHATELFIDHMIRWGIENGYDTLDVGATDPNYEDGLFSFKRSLGCELLPLVSWERGTSPAWPVVRAARWRKRAYASA